MKPYGGRDSIFTAARLGCAEASSRIMPGVMGAGPPGAI